MPQIQNQLDRKFCSHCQRNVFGTRPKPDMVILIISFFLVFPFLIYMVYYGLHPKDRCPICYSKVGPIDYRYPPFRGTPDSYDPSLIAKGKVIRTNPEVTNPEGNFVEFVPDNKLEKNKQIREIKNIPVKYCSYCGAEVDPNVRFCRVCGQPANIKQ